MWKIIRKEWEDFFLIIRYVARTRTSLQKTIFSELLFYIIVRRLWLQNTCGFQKLCPNGLSHSFCRQNYQYYAPFHWMLSQKNPSLTNLLKLRFGPQISIVMIDRVSPEASWHISFYECYIRSWTSEAKAST